MELKRYKINIFMGSNTICFSKQIFKFLNIEFNDLQNRNIDPKISEIIVNIDGGYEENEQLMVIFARSHLITSINYSIGFQDSQIRITIMASKAEVEVSDSSMTSCDDCDHKIACALNNV